MAVCILECREWSHCHSLSRWSLALDKHQGPRCGLGDGDKSCPRGAPDPTGVMNHHEVWAPQTAPGRPCTVFSTRSVSQPHPVITKATAQQKVNTLRAGPGWLPFPGLSRPRKGTLCFVFVQ